MLTHNAVSAGARATMTGTEVRERMTIPPSKRRVYRFGAFEVDADAGEMRKGGIRIRIQEQPLRLLTALMERPGELITREELRSRLWPDDTFVDFEHGLNTAATRLRQALRDSAQTPRFIESVPRRGYRFIAPLDPMNWEAAEVAPAAAVSAAAVNPAPGPAQWDVRTPRTLSRARALLWAVAGVFFASSLFLAWFSFRSRPRDLPQISYLLPPPAGAGFGAFDTTAISPDGRLLAYTATNLSGDTQLWIHSISDTLDRLLAGTEGAKFPFWSPDGRQIGFFANGKLMTIEASGGSPKTICVARSGRGGTWGGKGVIVFAPDEATSLFQVSAAGGEARPITVLKTSSAELSHRWPFFLPGGDHFLYTMHSAIKERSGVYLGSVESGGGQRLIEVESNAVYASSDGEEFILFVRRGTLMAQRFHRGGMILGGEPFRVAEGVGQAQFVEPVRANFSAAGNLLVYQSVRGADRLTWLGRDGATVGTVGEPGQHLSVAASRREKAVAIDILNPRTGTFDIWRIDTLNGAESRFTFDPGDHASPVWSPDGSRIAFASNAGRRGFDLYEKSISGAGGEKLLLTSDRFKIPTDWSPDGRYLLYWEVEGEHGNRNVWVLPMTGAAKPWKLVDDASDDREAVFSPDGKWFAYSSDRSGRREVWVQPFPPSPGTDRWMVSTAGGSIPQWSATGNELFYLAPDHRIMAVSITLAPVFRAGFAQALFQAKVVEDYRVHFAVSEDGRRFLIPIAADSTASPSKTVLVNWLNSVNK